MESAKVQNEMKSVIRPLLQDDDLSQYPLRRERRYSDFFFFNDTATTEIYTLSLHDALPISTECNSQTVISFGSPLKIDCSVSRSSSIVQKPRSRKAPS